MAANLYIPILIIFLQILRVSGSNTNKVSAIIIFGDSTVDAGNNNFIPTLARCNFHPYGRDFPGGMPTGRFCNGRLATDFFSESFGLKPTVPAYLDPMYDISDFATGVCFASAGTGFDNATADVLKVIPLWKEMEYYKDYQNRLRGHLGVEKANRVLRDALYVMSLGTNDFIENYYTIPEGRRSQFTVRQYQDFLLGIAVDFLKQLYSLGARKISVTGIAPMGCLPVERTTSLVNHHDFNCNEEYNNVALEFNGKLNNSIRKLNKELPGYRIVLADAYSITMELVKKPSKFGFEVADKGCCGSGTFEAGFLCTDLLTCTDANRYVFWDSVHPTEKANKIIADYLLTRFLKVFL